MKYIDADKLIAEIERLKETNKISTKEIGEYVQGGIYGFDLAIEKIVTFITSLHQEQQEVDLDREIIKYKVPFTDESEYLNETTLDAIARHFAEWGATHLNTKKED